MTRPIPLTSAIANLIHARWLGDPLPEGRLPDGQIPAGWIDLAAADIAWALMQQLDGTTTGTNDLHYIRANLTKAARRT